MAQQVRKNPLPKTSLFARIMFWLCIPLFFLGAIFTAIQLTNQIVAFNKIYRIESEIGFENIQKILGLEMKKPQTLGNLPALKRKVETLRSFYRLKAIHLFNLHDGYPLFPEDGSEWTQGDYQAIEKTLSTERKTGKPYYVTVDKDARQLTAYIPLKGPTEDKIFIARAAFSLADIKTAFRASRRTLFIIFFFLLLAGIVIGRGLSIAIIRPIRTLSAATQDIIHGQLGKHVSIRTGDEIETLARAFNQMSDVLKDMKRLAEDSNPLTGLPGNQGIFRELQRRIYERQKFVVFHLDLDRFKVFNDHYGLARGDEAIKKTAELLKRILKEKGAPDDFVGHHGGDDFILITRPQHAEAVAQEICRGFDQEIVPSIYRKEDLERGHTLQVDRRRLNETGEEVMVKFPLLAISLAGISSAKRDFADYFDCMSRAVPIKKEVKKTIKSSYLIQE